MAVLFLTIAGAVHTYTAMGELQAQQASWPGPVPSGAQNHDMVEEARVRLERRRQAREIAATDPELSLELRIGRPDLERSYDDGGLIDINHVPRWALTGSLGFTPEEADRVLEARSQIGRFTSTAEVTTFAPFAPDRLDPIQDLIIFG